MSVARATRARVRALSPLAAAAAVAAAFVVGGVPISSAAADSATVASSAAAGTTPPSQGPAGTLWGDDTANNLAQSTGSYDPTQDPGSLYTVENAIGARSVWWRQDSQKRQITGQGVGVALLDTGTVQVPGLDGQNKLSYGPDLSIESNSQTPLAHDTNGHGTFMAGIIAAHDGGPLTRQAMQQLSPSTQLGVAPDSEVESLKLATTDGSVDVSQVIAALDWVTQHPVMADGTPIRVINLAYGTDSLQPYQADPLAAAAENAWKHGIVVVVSAGNEGTAAGRLNDPAMDPYVLAVGASDGKESPAGWAFPAVAGFSSSGSTSRHPDLVAPGRSIVSLRAPGSFVDRNFPQGAVPGDTRLFRGSGTSQAASVTSGAVALLLQAYPQLTPDQVKFLLMQSASPVSGGTPTTSGAGEIDVASAFLMARLMTTPGADHVFPPSSWQQSWPSADGSGSIEAARGGDHLVDPAGNVVSGEIDLQGDPWNPQAWWAASSSLTAWNGGMWNGSTWTGSTWASTGAWNGSRWDASRWDASRWDGSRWDASRWDASRWDASRWDASRWDASRWDASRWDTGWSADNWN